MGMSSAVKLILGVSTLAMAAGFAGCDSGGSDNGGTAGSVPIGPGAGTGNNTAGGSGAGAPGAGGAGSVAGGTSAGVPLIPMDGFVPASSNVLGIQGYLISYGDDTSKAGPPAMQSVLTGTQACISGVAALVDLKCTPMPPATDCYGQFWGAAIALTLNQPPDTSVTPPVAGVAMPYDASMLDGFSFDLTGDMVPAPKDIRFNVEDAAGQYCNIPTHKVATNSNTFTFKDEVKACYKIASPPDGTNPTAETVQTKLIKISWQVVTNTSSTVPFNFCISNIRAIPKAGAVLPTGGAGASGVAGNSSAAGSSAAGSSAAGSSAAGSSSGGSSSGAGGSSAAGSSSGGTGGASAGSGGKSGSGG
jgi:hypothetical protein